MQHTTFESRPGLHQAEYIEYYTQDNKLYKKTITRVYMPRGDYQDSTATECLTKYSVEWEDVDAIQAQLELNMPQ